MIERWFPCQEVSANSNSGWGSGNTERNLFTWFAARPAAQAKAAVICSLLPWPDSEAEQERLQKLVREAMTGRYAKWKEVHQEIVAANRERINLLDPFSGRGMIPLEAARLGIPAAAMDYSPVAVLASELLTDYPFRDWSREPSLPFRSDTRLLVDTPRLLVDVEAFLNEVGRRFTAMMDDFYPTIGGRRAWGYLWAVTLPCQECDRRFPLVGSYVLRPAGNRKGKKGQPDVTDPGQSFYVEADPGTDEFRAVVHDGPPRRTPTLANAIDPGGKKVSGKSAVCPFCDHVHQLVVHQRLAGDGLGRDAMLVVAEIDPAYGKSYREPTRADFEAAKSATAALASEPPFGPMLPAVPDEQIPLNNGATIRPQLYGAKTYGDLMCDRQTLAFVRLAQVIAGLGSELVETVGMGQDYAKALAGYAASVLVRKIRRATRGCTLDPSRAGVHDIFVNEAAIAFSYDFFEAGLGDGPGTWKSMSGDTVTTLRALMVGATGTPATVIHGSAAEEPYRNHSMTVVVTDPPYDSMVYYADSSDLMYCWLKRALNTTHPEIAITQEPHGLQDKTDEIIVKEHGKAPGEHRDRDHYDTRIAKAFAEMRRVVRDDGLVTIVFGHGVPEVWRRLLGAIEQAGLVMTGSWPANTETSGKQGKATIETTLTMACRPAPVNRGEGRKAAVESEIKTEIKRRYPEWERWGLAPTDMLMAAAGPAMEIVGRYSVVLDARAEPVDIGTFLPLARAAVQEAMAIEIDHHPLETFDARTRFALWWVRVYGREIVAKSELRWQTLAASLELAEVRDLITDADKGCRFMTSSEFKNTTKHESSVIDVALTMAKAQEDGLQAVGEVLLASGRDTEDPYLWAAMSFLADRLPDSDADAIAFTRILRNRSAVGSAAKSVVMERMTADKQREAEKQQMRLL